MQPADLFEDMHRRCDDLLVSLDQLVAEEDWERAELAYGRFRTSMRAHFDAEEEELFPAFERQALFNSTSTHIMRNEHHRMNQLMDHMGGTIAVQDKRAYADESRRLRSLLAQHGRKEDFLIDAVFGSGRDLARNII